MRPISNSHAQKEFFIPAKNIITLVSSKDLSVGYKDRNFFIELPSGERKSVLPYDLSGGLELAPPEDSLKKALELGKIYLTTIGEDYKLRFGISAKGGGPICGAIAYWGTKAAIYGGIAGAVGATGGLAGAAITGAVGSVAGGGLAAGAVAGAAGHIAAGSAVAVAETTAVVGGTLGVAGTISAIEGTAAAVSMFFTALPFCP